MRLKEIYPGMLKEMADMIARKPTSVENHDSSGVFLMAGKDLHLYSKETKKQWLQACKPILDQGKTTQQTLETITKDMSHKKAIGNK